MPHTKLLSSDIYNPQPAPVLVLLHGLFGQARLWRSHALRFSENFSVHVVNLRNHGSSFHSDKMSYALMAEDLKRYFKAHNIDAAHLLGHSMGGKVAMQFALSYPQLAQSIIVADIAPVSYLPRHHSVFAAVKAMQGRLYSSRQMVKQTLDKHLKSEAVKQFLLTNLKQDAQKNYHWQSNMEAIMANYKPLSSAVVGKMPYLKPSLFIKGELSDYIIDAYLAVIERYFSNYQLQTIADSGHWLHVEKSAQFYQICSDFLRTL